ncbi:MAG: hypothetical protein ABJP87_01380, partial [Bauldia litoralis]|uniref:hypothetical protein n=1 Tax=Bauldia litoralis TaxID=665467 RepID=UPI00329A45CB
MVAIAYGIPSRQPVTLSTMNGTRTISALSVGLDSCDDGEVKLAALGAAGGARPRPSPHRAPYVPASSQS